MKFNVAISVAVTVSILASHAKAESWPPQAKQAYVSRCAGEMAQQGIRDAKKFCQCMADGLETTFGNSRMQEMLAAQPNPNGTQTERDLFRVIEACPIDGAVIHKEAYEKPSWYSRLLSGAWKGLRTSFWIVTGW